jgi:membrane-bound serine protease (ClpP class)
MTYNVASVGRPTYNGFMGSHMKNLHVGVIAILAALLFVPRLWAESPPAPSQPGQPAAIVPLVGQIDDYSRDDLIKRFEKAKALGAKTIIVSIDSPGGVVTPSMEISRYLKRQSDVHTIAFVKEKAYSGAAMVAVACDEIWMAPDSPLGDCAPIIFDTSGGVTSMGDTERAKEEGPVVTEFLDSARRNGYDPLLLESMVTIKRPVMVVQNGKGAIKVVSESAAAHMAADGWKPAPGYDSVNGAGKLVTVYPAQAIALGLAKGEISSEQALASKLGDPLIADLTPSFGEKLVQFLGNPLIRMILLTIFLQSLYIAIHAPGHGAAEAIAVISLGLLIGIPLLTGYATWWEVGAIFLGLGLCAFEIFVFPGHFVSLILGSLLVVGGLVMTFVPMGVPGWLPSAAAAWHGVQNGLLAILGALVCWVLLSMWLRRYLPSIPYFRKLILTATTGNAATLPAPGDKEPRDLWPFIGTVGVAATDLRPGGSVHFPYGSGTRASAVVSTTGYLPEGSKVIVEEIQGSSVRVRPVA